MNASSPIVPVEEWFLSAKTASMELPDGWFGRPYDNMHQLTWAAARPDKLILELDGQLYLVLSRCVIASHTADVLELHCDQAVFDWKTYGRDGEWRVTTYTQGGTVRFHASGA